MPPTETHHYWASTRAMNNPYSPPPEIELGTDATLISPRDYGGIGRIAFVGIMIGVWIARSFLDAEIITTTPGGVARLTIGLFLLVVIFASCAYRLKNVGSSPCSPCKTLFELLLKKHLSR